MTKVVLLEQLSQFTKDVTKDLILPCALQKGDEKRTYRPVDVYQMRVPTSSAAKKYVPYILHTVILGEDSQMEGQRTASSAVVRSIFSVYDDESEEEGALMLLNLMERLRINLLSARVIGRQFELDLTQKIEYLIYPDNTAPYFAGEMKTVWKLPSIERNEEAWL